MINFFKWMFGKGKDEGPKIITLDEVLTTSQEFFTDVEVDDLCEYFKEMVEGVIWEDLDIDHDCLLEIEEQTVFDFGRSWKRLETIEEQRHYLRLTVVNCMEKSLWNKGYFSVGNKNIRAMVFRQIQNNDDELQSVAQDEYEKDLYINLVRFFFNYGIALNLLREYLNDGRENDYPARFAYEYEGFVDVEFKQLLARAEKDSEKIEFYEDELQDWRKAVEIQRGLVLSFWDVTCETMVSTGFDTNMVCDN